MTPKQLDALPSDRVEELWEAITVLEAQEVLLRYNIGIYPKLKATAQKAEHRRLHKIAYPTKLYPPKTVSIKDLAKKLNG